MLQASLEADPQDYITQALLHKLEDEIQDVELISAWQAQKHYIQLGSLMVIGVKKDFSPC
jgi:hypothetical protein